MTSMLGRGVDTPPVVPVQRAAEHLFVDGGDGAMTTYSELLRDPRWQKKRLEVLEDANWTCTRCYDDETELHVHHLRYRWNVKPWDYDLDELRCLCKTCHARETAAWSLLKDKLMLEAPASVLVPLVAGYMVGIGFLWDQSEEALSAKAMAESTFRIGVLAATLDTLPDDLFGDVIEAIGEADHRSTRRMRAFAESMKSDGPSNA